MPSTRAFVVRMGQFIEFRTAREAPKARVSRVVRRVRVRQPVYNYNTGLFRDKYRLTRFTLEQTFYVGRWSARWTTKPT